MRVHSTAIGKFGHLKKDTRITIKILQMAQVRILVIHLFQILEMTVCGI